MGDYVVRKLEDVVKIVTVASKTPHNKLAQQSQTVQEVEKNKSCYDYGTEVSPIRGSLQVVCYREGIQLQEIIFIRESDKPDFEELDVTHI